MHPATSTRSPLVLVAVLVDCTLGLPGVTHQARTLSEACYPIATATHTERCEKFIPMGRPIRADALNVSLYTTGCLSNRRATTLGR